jgi:hypothetical protein
VAIIPTVKNIGSPDFGDTAGLLRVAQEGFSGGAQRASDFGDALFEQDKRDTERLQNRYLEAALRGETLPMNDRIDYGAIQESVDQQALNRESIESSNITQRTGVAEAQLKENQVANWQEKFDAEMGLTTAQTGAAKARQAASEASREQTQYLLSQLKKAGIDDEHKRETILNVAGNRNTLVQDAIASELANVPANFTEWKRQNPDASPQEQADTEALMKRQAEDSGRTMGAIEAQNALQQQAADAGIPYQYLLENTATGQEIVKMNEAGLAAAAFFDAELQNKNDFKRNIKNERNITAVVSDGKGGYRLLDNAGSLTQNTIPKSDISSLMKGMYGGDGLDEDDEAEAQYVHNILQGNRDAIKEAIRGNEKKVGWGPLEDEVYYDWEQIVAEAKEIATARQGFLESYDIDPLAPTNAPTYSTEEIARQLAEADKNKKAAAANRAKKQADAAKAAEEEEAEQERRRAAFNAKTTQMLRDARQSARIK